LLAPELGGGALLDVGCYTIAYACMVFGAPPRRVRADASLGVTGVDEQVAMTMAWDGGRLAVASAAVRTSTNRDCWIYGTEGRIHVPSFWQARTAILYRDGSGPEAATPTFVGNGYNYQAEEVARCIASGKAESKGMPLGESVAVMEVMDEARRQIGLVYPMEPAG
jgi:predicted dehydrogenase